MEPVLKFFFALAFFIKPDGESKPLVVAEIRQRVSHTGPKIFRNPRMEFLLSLFKHPVILHEPCQLIQRVHIKLQSGQVSVQITGRNFARKAVFLVVGHVNGLKEHFLSFFLQELSGIIFFVAYIVGRLINGVTVRNLAILQSHA